MLQFINKVEIQGVVGKIQRSVYGNKAAVAMSVCTQTAYNNANGIPVVDTLWIQVAYWTDANDNHFPYRGDWINATGRLRSRKYMTPDKEEHTTYDLLAETVEIIQEDGKDE